MRKEVYVVTAYRYGKRENHSYVVGVFDKKHKAIKSADSQTEYRGGKYTCVVDACILGDYSENIDENVEGIYKSKGIELDKY